MCVVLMLDTLISAVVCFCVCVPVRLAAMFVAATHYLTHAPGRRSGAPLHLNHFGAQARGDRDDSYEYGAPEPEPEPDRYV
jgi:hypothetical protein